jgi:hypothetical protein
LLNDGDDVSRARDAIGDVCEPLVDLFFQRLYSSLVAQRKRGVYPAASYKGKI